MKSSANKSATALLALLLACGCWSEASGQVTNLILTPRRAAVVYDYVDKLPAEKKSAIVTIEGKHGDGTASGTGFFAKIKDSVFLVTNMHVMCGLETFQARTMEGTLVPVSSVYGAYGADIALLKLTEEPKAYFDTEISVDTVHRAGDAILVPGNSQGEGTIMQTEGRIVAIGPARIEHNAPTFHGNSGSPILSEDSWKVLGVDTLSITVDSSDYFDLASLKNPASQIKSKVRLFGYRLDSVAQWDPIDWRRFSQQAKNLEEAEKLVTAIQAVFSGDVREWQRHPRTNAIMRELEDLVRKPRVSETDITNKIDNITVNFRNAVKKVEQDAIESKTTCYWYIAQEYQNLGVRAKRLREEIANMVVRR